MQVKKQQLEPDMEQQTGSKLGKEHVKSIYCHCLFNLHAEYIVRNAGMEEARVGIKIAGVFEISITSDMQMTPPLWQREKSN